MIFLFAGSNYCSSDFSAEDCCCFSDQDVSIKGEGGDISCGFVANVHRLVGMDLQCVTSVHTSGTNFCGFSEVLFLSPCEHFIGTTIISKRC